MVSPAKPAVYSSIGNTLLRHELDTATLTLFPRGRLTLPENGQYAWPHPQQRVLYVACSDGAPGSRGHRHCACAVRIDQDREPALHGPVIALPGRPVHITVDAAGRHALIAYNDPSALTVHRIAADGTLGELVPQRTPVDAGIFAHQTRILPGNRTALLVTRGNDATDRRPEDPGSLHVFDYDDGQLTPRTVIAPGGGYGYGPRHVDHAPSGRALYVALERQNRLHVHDITAAGIDAAPRHVVATLQQTESVQPQQRAGTLHVHPNGRTLYLANRADGLALRNGRPVFAGGENNIAVYALDGAAPRVIQHVDTHGFVPRTFALDATGQVMIVANSRALTRADGSRTPTSLVVFRIRDDGTLEHVRTYPISTDDDTLFWMGLP